VFLNGVIKGDLDADLTGHPVHRDDLAGRIDWLGINYYTRVTVEGLADPAFPHPVSAHHLQPVHLPALGGLPARNLRDGDAGQGLRGPSFVTENGTTDPNDDGTTPSYLVRHLTCLSARCATAPRVRGYFYWTLIDTYEWNAG